MRQMMGIGVFGVLLIAGCGGGGVTQTAAPGHFAQGDDRFANETQPAQALQADACALLEARPHWREALRTAQQNWQIEPWYVLAFMHQESRFNPTAMSSSRAYGLPQAKDGTWQWYEDKRGRANSSRERFDDSVDFIGWYAHQNVARNGVPLNDVRNQYLAYHEGLGGFEQASFIGKPWLLSVTDKVVDRAMLYQAQLFECPL
ncbi:transglycosylase SLT domain-containing protein [Suttonella sp. R2A3]|uniref:transglycosylase SLT domain-containing protein n=1 Tax=Suttonella sp. R2A3 TaxID=2908648 RepID=UPI001F294D25|nr:transglycosylase SLT domain-containing protein [Suttonella sp. R2A3]UJF24746.1 transglycosylase SLT domain-containing protein [Suttonella sp. R2A3]